MKISAIVLFVTAVMLMASTALAEVPGMINYQGRLTDDLGDPLDTTVSIVFTIYDDSTGGSTLWTETHSTVSVTGGLFNVILGSSEAIDDTVFADTARWLGITVGTDAEITPLTRLMSIPFAFRVSTVDGSTGGVIYGKATIGSNNINNTAYGLVAGSYNGAMAPGTAVLGGQSNTASEQYAVVTGGSTNQASGQYSVVSGGAMNMAKGSYSFIGNGLLNFAESDGSVVVGGSSNNADSQFTFLGGGFGNSAKANYATIGGGYGSEASGLNSFVGGGRYCYARGDYSVVGGGGGLDPADSNLALGGSSVVSGGFSNLASGYYSAVGGGHKNTATDTDAAVGGGSFNNATSPNATVPGGYNNDATGSYSFAAGLSCEASGFAGFAMGHYAIASHDGSFVWNDHLGGYSASSDRDNQFKVSADGGVKLEINEGEWFDFRYILTDPPVTNQVLKCSNGAKLSTGGTWTDNSDRNSKENFDEIDREDLLDKIASLPITRWNYINEQSNITHIGPVSQDFHTAFGVGDELGIAALDGAGVALAAIQELHRKNTELESEVDDLKTQVANLTSQVEAIMTQLKPGSSELAVNK